VELENIASPPTKQSPELRYASLHRAVEQGIASGDVWLELAEVCLQLGHCEEAVRAWKTMPDGSARNRLESLLARRQLIQPPDPLSQTRKASPQQVVALPLEEAVSTSLGEHVLDGVQYLFTGRMLLLALVATLAFPVIVGLGGFLTAGSSMLVLAAMAALPGMCVLGIVGALGRRILVSSSRGEEEVPALPGLSDLTHAAGRFLGDATLEIVALIGPPLLWFYFDGPISTCLPALLFGALLLPMAHALRQVRDDFRAYSPGVLLPAIGSTLIPYLGIALSFWAMFLPAAVTAYATMGNPIWLQLSVVGPLTVLPIFVTSRFLGTFLDVHRQRLGKLLGAATAPAKAENPMPPTARRTLAGKKVATRVSQPAAAAAPATARPAAARQATARPTARPQPSPHHPAAGVQAQRPAKTTAPATKGLAGYVAQAKAAEPTAGAAGKPTRTVSKTNVHPSVKAPSPAPRLATPAAAPAPRPVDANASPVSPAVVIGDPVPTLDEELAQIPGAKIVRGADRQRLGASALKQDR
jgi:hypothetical protein